MGLCVRVNNSEDKKRHFIQESSSSGFILLFTKIRLKGTFWNIQQSSHEFCLDCVILLLEEDISVFSAEFCFIKSFI